MAIMIADGSDDPADLVLYHHVLEDGFDCAFGSRFIGGSRVTEYPRLKLILNRLVNWGSGRCSGTATTTPPTPSRPTGAK